MTETAGVDFSFQKPDPAVLVAAGHRFVVGYVSPLKAGNVPNPKDLTPQLITNYRRAGLAVALVYESTADRAMAGHAAGMADGATARSRARALGYPTDCVIFFAVDFDARPAQLAKVLAYGDGFASQVGHPTGPYGSHRVIDAMAGKFGYLWQTAAWSGGQLHSAAHLYQRNRKHWPDVPGTDECVLLRPFPWLGTTPAAPAPVKPPVPIPGPGKVPTTLIPAPPLDVAGWRVQRGDQSVHIENLQRWGNRHYPLYCAIADTDPTYGPKTVAFVRQFAHRSDILSADGENIGPKIAAALQAAGFRG